MMARVWFDPMRGTDRRRAKDAGKRKEALCQSKEDRFNIAKQARLIKNTGIAGPNHDDARRTSHGKKAPATEHGIELRVRGGKAKEHDMKDSGKGKALIEIRAEGNLGQHSQKGLFTATRKKAKTRMLAAGMSMA